MSAPRAPAEDTIAARATPAGRSPRAMIRLSGSQTFQILEGLLEGFDAGAAKGSTARSAVFRLDASTRAPVRILCFRAPHSYTGEDVAEIHLAGAPQLAADVLGAVFAAGARPAGPGEFTRRAYLDGRLDLTRAEGIQALIAAGDDAERRGALALTGGRIATRVEALRESLVTLLADMEATIDFPEHEIDPEGLPAFGERIDDLEAQLDHLLDVTRGEDRPPGQPRVMLWGHPNAGKSTLFNRLIGRDRVATSAAPGTTRDVLGGRFWTGRGDVLVFDSPGIGLRSTGEADEAALRTAALQREGMDLRLVVADLSASRPPPDPGPGDCLLVLAKSDLERRLRPRAWVEAHGPVAVVEVSSVTGHGIAQLRNALGNWLAGASPGQDVVVSAGRLRALFLRAQNDLKRLRAEHGLGYGPECLNIHVRALISALEEVTGRVFTEELLDSVFSRFCIGK